MDRLSQRDTTMYRKNNASNKTTGPNRDSENIAVAIKTHGLIVVVAFSAIVAITWVLISHSSGRESSVKATGSDGKHQMTIEGRVSPSKK